MGWQKVLNELFSQLNNKPKEIHVMDILTDSQRNKSEHGDAIFFSWQSRVSDEAVQVRES